MTTFHLRKTNSPGSNPRVVDWIATFDDDTGICTSCTTIEGKPSPAFLGRDIDFIDRWLNIGKVDGVAYHEIVDDLSTD